MYVCVYIIYDCVCIFICMYMCIYIYTYLCVYVYIYVYICIYVYMYIYIYLSIHVYIYIYIDAGDHGTSHWEYIIFYKQNISLWIQWMQQCRSWHT